MKLLGWMHRKLKHNCNDRTTAQIALDDGDQNRHADPTYAFSSLPANPNTTLKYPKEEKPPLMNELFHGFLAIGTLGGGGSEALFNNTTTEPPTPTFPTSYEDYEVAAAHETTQITDQDLKIISKELEKFLEAEEAASEDAQSSKRSSYASIITLTDKTQQDSLLDCPLQKYFFGSSIIEVSEAADMAAVKKEEEALSSEEIEMEILKGNCEGDKKRGKAQFAKNFMKKMLKNLNSSKSKTTHANGGPTESSSTKNKFPKVLKMFKKKVHPERINGEKESEKDDEKRAITAVKGNCLRSRSDTGNIWFRKMITPEEELIRTSAEYFDSGRVGAFMENNEHWIKTDADYLVLEL